MSDYCTICMDRLNTEQEKKLRMCEDCQRLHNTEFHKKFDIDKETEDE